MDNLKKYDINEIYQSLKNTYLPYLQQRVIIGRVFFLLKTLIAFNSGKIKMGNLYNYYHITIKTCLSPFLMRKCDPIALQK